MIFDVNNEQTAQRTDIAVFFDVTGYDGVTADEGVTVYARAGVAWTSFTENPNAQTKARKFINEKTERNNITRYSPQWSFEVLLMFERPEIRHLYNVVKKRMTGSDTHMRFIVVDLFDVNSDGTYTARMVNAAPQVSSLDDDDDMIVKGTFYNQGDEILGRFDMENGTFTADEEEEETETYTLTTSEPEDWATNYNYYYTKSGDNYIKNNEQSAPTWEADTYYKKTIGA